MSHTVNEQDIYPTTVPSTDINDTNYPSVVNDALTNLTNRTHRLALSLGQDTNSAAPWEDILEGNVLSPDMTGGAPFSLPQLGRLDWLRLSLMEYAAKIVGLRSLTAQPYDEQISIGASALGQPQWTQDFGAAVPGMSQTDVSFPYALVYPITATMADPTQTFGTCPTPRGISRVRARVGKLSGAAHASAPATKRILELCYSDLYASPPATVIVATATDSAASGATYDAFHDISLALTSGQAVITNATRMWFVRLKGESGANSVTGHGLIDLRICYTLIP